MTQLKRNSIELMKEMNGDEVVMQRYWTPPFTPMKVTKEAVEMMMEFEKTEIKKKTFSFEQMSDMIEKMAEFVANRLYAGQFTKEELEERYHAPDTFQGLKAQVEFVATGMQDNSTQAFLKSKR